MKNLITYKIKYKSNESDSILTCIKDYNKILKFTYNRILKDKILGTKELTAYQKKLNNVSLDSHFKNSAIFEAKGLINLNKEKSVCFGKKAYHDYSKNLITKEELDLQKLLPIYSVGEANSKGNRKFKIINEREIIFKPNKNTHITLHLENYKNYKKNLCKLQELQDSKLVPITYKMDSNYVYLTFDLNQVKDVNNYHTKENRVFAIDLNPNYIGYSIVDWKDENNYRIVKEGTISIKDLNDYDNSLKNKGLDSSSKQRRYITNKRNYEVCNIGIWLVNQAKHYRCEIFAMEDLSLKSCDKEKGKNYNKLCNNQWCRNKLVQIIEKYCKLTSIKLLKVMANYSSFIGNLVYRDESIPDMELSSIEIGRRGYEFTLQYLRKIKQPKKNIIFPELHSVKDRIDHALEVLGYSEEYENLQKLYYSLKNLRLKYRVSLEKLKFDKVFSLFYNKSYTKLYSFK